MRKKIIFLICIVLLIGLAIFLIVSNNSEITKNTKKIEKRLLDYGACRVGKIEELINFEYDRVYSITKEMSKEEIEKYIGVKNNIIKSNHNNEMNIIFIKDGKIIAYLQGDKTEKGYYIYLSDGEYFKEELNKKSFTARAKDKYLNYEIAE